MKEKVKQNLTPFSPPFELVLTSEAIYYRRTGRIAKEANTSLPILLPRHVKVRKRVGFSTIYQLGLMDSIHEVDP